MTIIEQKDFPEFINKCGNLFNSPGWLNVLKNTYGFEFNAVIDEEKSFFLPYCVIDKPFYPSVKSIPFSDYTLIGCKKNKTTEALDLLRKKYPNHYIETTLVCSKKPEIINFTSTKYGYLIQIDIKKWKESRDWKEAYERNIRNALNYGLSVQINKKPEGINGFYALHEHLRINKFKKLPQPVRFFNNIFHEFIKIDKGFFLEAWNRNRLIASWFILIHNQILYYKFGASDPEYLKLRPNDLLFRSLMQYGSDNRFRTIDLGFSGASKSYEGLIRFKSKEGGVKTPIYRIERYPDNFDKNLIAERTEYLHNLSKKAIETGDSSQIREISNRFYGEFA